MLVPLLVLASQPPNLVPERVSKAPDYFCTWNIQGYRCSYTGGPATRKEMDQANLFGKGPHQDWLGFFPSVRGDLLFVMDDAWDVPPDNDERAYGRLQLDEKKFPGYQGDAAKRLSGLTRDVKKRGWKGLGGWVCASECGLLPSLPREQYWRDRLQEISKGGMTYLKVDWGAHDKDVEWRRLLAKLKPTAAPNTIIESAMVPASLAYADTYRTYDVEVVTSAPETLNRIASLLASPNAQGSPTIVNCEDEVFIGAGLGCSYGVMRHPLAGPLPNGKPDFVFPTACRDLKRRLDEVTRAVRWHRLAPPIPAGQATFRQSPERLTDHWTMAENESWVDRKPGSVVTASAPAIMSRGLPLPKVTCAEPEPPFIAAARYPSGCLSVAAIGRALGRTYRTPLADVEMEGVIGKTIGIFGHFKTLTLHLPSPPKKIWAQDLAANRAVDITNEVQIKGNTLTLSGKLLTQIGLSASTKGDVSDPGLVVRINK